jgi:hypothetical protein
MSFNRHVYVLHTMINTEFHYWPTKRMQLSHILEGMHSCTWDKIQAQTMTVDY